MVAIRTFVNLSFLPDLDFLSLKELSIPCIMGGIVLQKAMLYNYRVGESLNV
jgi:hypothetical protein